MTAPGEELWTLERRNDGAVIVRVPSQSRAGAPLPEAVFAFRRGEPQYFYWDSRLRLREGEEFPGLSS